MMESAAASTDADYFRNEALANALGEVLGFANLPDQADEVDLRQADAIRKGLAARGWFLAAVKNADD